MCRPNIKVFIYFPDLQTPIRPAFKWFHVARWRQLWSSIGPASNPGNLSLLTIHFKFFVKGGLEPLFSYFARGVHAPLFSYFELSLNAFQKGPSRFSQSVFFLLFLSCYTAADFLLPPPTHTLMVWTLYGRSLKIPPPFNHSFFRF